MQISSNLLFLLILSANAINLAVIRPFSKNDYQGIGDSFSSWNKFIPCNASDKNNYDLYLSYSQDLENGYGLKYVSPVIKTIQDIFHTQKEEWTKCFRKLYLHSCNIKSEEDIYKPYQYGENHLWVNGPNQQFMSIANLMNDTDAYHSWYLMEMDSIPRKSGFLTALSEDIEKEQPFSILGSIYRGDRWDMFMNEIHPFLKNHINGNAVYNTSHPMTQFILRQLQNEKNTVYETIPYDYRISQIVYESIYIHDSKTFNLMFNENIRLDKQSFYKGHSKVIGNYASTNMLPELYNNEYIVHGAINYQKWDQERIGLVVTDWGNGDLQQFHQIVGSGDHPFSEIVYVVPFHQLPKEQKYIMKGKRGPILIQFKTRNQPNGTNNQDYIDYCYHQPETTDYFMITNTYMRISSPVHLSIHPISKLPVANYIPYNSGTCQNFKECVEIINEARVLMSDHIEYMVQDMSMVFHKNHTGSLLTQQKGYCTKWFESFKNQYPHINHSKCIPKYGPSATGYLAYLGNKKSEYYHFSNVITKGSRETVIPHRVPPLDNFSRYCTDHDPIANRQRRIATIATSLALVERRETILSNALINCINNIDNPKKCNSTSYCWWRPIFNKCVQIHETTDTYEQQYRLRNSHTLGEGSRYNPSTPPPPPPPPCPPPPECNCPSSDRSGDDDSNASMIIALALVGSAALCLLIPLAILIGLGILACIRRRTLTGTQRHLSSTQQTIIPSIIPMPYPPPPPQSGMFISEAPVVTIPNTARSDPFFSPRLPPNTYPPLNNMLQAPNTMGGP